MAIFATTLSDLVKRVCQLYLHDWYEGTTTSAGSSTTFVDTSRPESDDYFNSLNASIYLKSGSYAGSTRAITDWVASTYTGTFAPALAGNSGSGVTYSIHSRFPRAEVVQAINDAIDQVAEEALFWKVDESVTLTAGTYEYALPTSFMYITNVTMQDTVGKFRKDPVKPSLYKIIHASSPLLQFTTSGANNTIDGFNLSLDEFAPTDTYKLRIEGLASPAILYTDTDTCPISPKFICAQAAATMCFSRAGMSADTDYAKQAGVWQQIADVERQRVVKIQLPINAKRVRE